MGVCVACGSETLNRTASTPSLVRRLPASPAATHSSTGIPARSSSRSRSVESQICLFHKLNLFFVVVAVCYGHHSIPRLANTGCEVGMPGVLFLAWLETRSSSHLHCARSGARVLQRWYETLDQHHGDHDDDNEAELELELKHNPEGHSMSVGSGIRDCYVPSGSSRSRAIARSHYREIGKKKTLLHTYKCYARG